MFSQPFPNSNQSIATPQWTSPSGVHVPALLSGLPPDNQVP